MSDYLSNLIHRNFKRDGLILPRLGSLFEPAPGINPTPSPLGLSNVESGGPELDDPAGHSEPPKATVAGHPITPPLEPSVQLEMPETESAPLPARLPTAGDRPAPSAPVELKPPTTIQEQLRDIRRALNLPVGVAPPVGMISPTPGPADSGQEQATGLDHIWPTFAQKRQPIQGQPDPGGRPEEPGPQPASIRDLEHPPDPPMMVEAQNVPTPDVSMPSVIQPAVAETPRVTAGSPTPAPLDRWPQPQVSISHSEDRPAILPTHPMELPVIKVTIGRIEVRATTPPSRQVAPVEQAQRPRPALSLDAYLKQREGRR